MTEPDEALLWAREDYAKQFRSRRSHVAASILSGFWDIEVEVKLPAHGYRAGSAASAERIKELEAALKDSVTAMRLLLDAVQKHNSESDTFLSGFPLHLLSIEIAAARALLKEPDQ